MVLVESNYTFLHPWPLTTFANWIKYPNEHSSHVISVDVISRHVDEKGHLVTDRLLQLKQPIPQIFSSLGFNLPEVTYFYERSRLNRVSQEYEASSQSLTMRSFFTAYEVCHYSSDPKTGGTVLCQKAEFTAFSFFSKIIEGVAASTFLANAARGRQGLETVIAKIGVEADEFLSSAFEIEARVTDGVKDFMRFERESKSLETSSPDGSIVQRVLELHKAENPFSGIK